MKITRWCIYALFLLLSLTSCEALIDIMALGMGAYGYGGYGAGYYPSYTGNNSGYYQPQSQSQSNFANSSIGGVPASTVVSTPITGKSLFEQSSINGVPAAMLPGMNSNSSSGNSSSTSSSGHITQSQLNRQADRAAKSAEEAKKNPSVWSAEKARSDQKLLDTYQKALKTK